MKFLLHAPAWLTAAQLPLQTAVLAYIGAGGLAGAAVVVGVMLSPVGEVVQEAVAPARAFVESVVPMSVPSILPMDPRQAVAHLPIGKSQVPSVATPRAVATPVAVDDVVPQEDGMEAPPTSQSLVIAPLRSSSAPMPAQPTLAPGQADQPEIGLPLRGGPSPIGPAAVADRPVAAIERAAPALPARPAAAVAVEVRTSSLSEVASDAQVRASSVPKSPRVAVANANTDNLRAASVASPTAIVVHASTGRASEPSPTAVATPRPASVPTEAPTEAPTSAPTQAATAAPTRVPTQAATRVPTEEPKKTAAPTQEPKKTAVPTKVPPRPVKAVPAPTSAPTRAVPTATPAKEKEQEKRPTPTPTRRDPHEQLGRTADPPPASGHEGD